MMPHGNYDKQIIAALVKQIESLGSVAAVSVKAIMADPPEILVIHNEARSLYYLRSITPDERWRQQVKR